ncbi:MAG: hypothetical protein LBV43_00080 [Prevotella sp.]|nr:hypothetical protein [Prevotella sp.]
MESANMSRNTTMNAHIKDLLIGAQQMFMMGHSLKPHWGAACFRKPCRSFSKCPDIHTDGEGNSGISCFKYAVTVLIIAF